MTRSSRRSGTRCQTARLADPQKPDTAGTKTAQASELPASNVAPALRRPIQPATKQTQTGAQTPSTADRFNDLGRHHSYVEQSPIAPQRKPIPRLFQAHVEHLPAPSKAAAAQSSEIEPRQASQLQPQAQIQASPQTTSQISATTAAAPMAKLQVDQRTEATKPFVIRGLTLPCHFALNWPPAPQR